MFQLAHKLDVYITNVCNMTCDQCNRFNNHDFRGWQRWSDYETQYQQWAGLLKIPAVTIMGGEPFLNPTLPDWVTGIGKLFDVDVQILTNGTRFRQAGRLYDALLYSRSGQIKNHIAVSLHRSDQFEKLKEDILWFLKAPVEILPQAHENNHHNSDWCFIDSNGIMINVYIKDQFHTAAIRPFTRISQPMQKTYLLHNSDPFFCTPKLRFCYIQKLSFCSCQIVQMWSCGTHA
jgi:organic radical activating enzyme